MKGNGRHWAARCFSLFAAVRGARERALRTWDQKLAPKLANSDTSRARFCIVVVLMPMLLLRPHRFRRAPSTAVA